MPRWQTVDVPWMFHYAPLANRGRSMDVPYALCCYLPLGDGRVYVFCYVCYLTKRQLTGMWFDPQVKARA